MKRTITAFFLLLMLCLIYLVMVVSVSAQESDTRGMMRVKIREGRTIQLYGGSYALVIGNGDYQKGWDRLKGAVSDAAEVAKALEKHGFQVTLRTDVTKDEFDREFGQFAVSYGRDKDNRLLFYYAGHGYTEKMATGEELGYIVMVDTPTPEKDPVGFEMRSVDMVSIVTRAKKLNALHVLFMFDSCFSGSILNLREKVTPESITDSVRYPVRQFVTAGRADEPVPDYSVFKQAFLDLIERRDKEPIPDGYITGEELGLYLKNKVPEYNRNQHPQYGKIKDPKLDKGDFVFRLPPPAIPPPPSGSDFAIDDLMEEADRIEAIRTIKAAWASQLQVMKKAYSEAMAYEKRDVSPDLKAEMWKRALEAFKEDNPYSQEDEKMREGARLRIERLRREPKRATKTEAIKPLPPEIIDEEDMESGVLRDSETHISADSRRLELVGRSLGRASDVHTVGNYAYLCAGCFLVVLDVSDPANPMEVSRIDTSGITWKVYVTGNHAYVADYEKGLRVIDISTPTNPVQVGFYDTPHAHEICTLEGYAYVASTMGLRVMDVSTPTNLVEVGFYDTPGEARGVYVLDGYAYVADGREGLRVIDISIPTEPLEVRFYDTPGYADEVFVLDRYVYMADGNGGICVFLCQDVHTQENATGNLPENIVGEDGAEMALIPAGEFRMGSNDGSDNEKSVHIVYIDKFYMDKYEVTNALYKKFMDATGHKAPYFWSDGEYNAPDQPVVGVTWYDAVAYAEWAGKRLPTEAQWEKAARGGLVRKRYPWGDNITHDDANYSGTGEKDIWNGTAPVGNFAPNGYGMYDMVGNVWEWCADWYDERYYASSPESNPTGPASGTSRVVRGGSWGNFPNYLRAAYRYYFNPSFSYRNFCGFRCIS